MDLKSLPKLLASQPKPMAKLISHISQKMSKDSEPDTGYEFMSLVTETLSLEPEPELISLILKVFSLVISMKSKWKKLISLCPQIQVYWARDKMYVTEEAPSSRNDTWSCLPTSWDKYRLTGKEAIHFLCRGCSGGNHEEYSNAPIEVRHILHPRHSLHLVLWNYTFETRQCYCCDENLRERFYFCVPCDFAMNIACVEKPPVLAIDRPKCHEQTLALFPRQASLTCNIYALADSSSPIYMCPPCSFVVHLRCTSLTRVIRIFRHLHRISFTPYFDQGDWSCGICHKRMDNDYGGYSCIKDDCSYAAHSRCATQSNVWDGKEFEGIPEEVEEQEEPFICISDVIIQHFNHQHHHLRLDENTGRDYDENMQCQACIMPIFDGNLYSCMQCDFILHERCANLSREICNPIHPHILTLVTKHAVGRDNKHLCSACPWMLTAGFFYACSKVGCHFQLHVQCATIPERLLHKSHEHHPLFLTSKSGKQSKCSVCREARRGYSQTFNCIECDFALCFGCATLPQKVRYTDDKHFLSLSYGKETSTNCNWCEECECKIGNCERFYMCEEYCCVTVHIECLFGSTLYMKPGSSWFHSGRKIDVLLHNPQMSRPICSFCRNRCKRIYYQCLGLIVCSTRCINMVCFREVSK